MQELIRSLLCKRRRRIELLMYWHANSVPYEAEMDFHNIIYRFINSILYEPLQVSMHGDYLIIIKDLKIPYAFLNEKERKIVKDLFINRAEHFGVCEFFVTNYRLTRYRSRLEFSTLHRRELVRDFVVMLLKRQYRYALLHVIQTRFLAPESKRDAFIVAVHEVLQGRTKLNELVCIQ